MPGKRDTATVISNWISNPALYRTITASDTDLSFTDTIDFTYSPFGIGNTLVIMPSQTSGSGRIKFDLYVNFPTGAVPTTWFLHTSTDWISSAGMLVVQNLFGGVYKLKATLEVPGDNIAVYAMWTDLKKVV